MEKVVYDLYLAEAGINANYNIFSTDSARRRDLLNSVLKKHKITEAKLDTSLAWYSTNLDKFVKINNKVSKRFAEDSEALRKLDVLVERKNLISDENNLVLPVEKERFFLRISDLPNKIYTFKADTVLNRFGGRYELQFNILGVSKSLNPVVTLCVQCIDTAFIKQDTIRNNGLFSTSIDIIQGKQAKALYGSIYFPEIYKGMGIFVRDFSLDFTSKILSVAEPTEQIVPVSIQDQP